MRKAFALLLALALPAQAESPPQILAAEILPGWTTESGTRMAALHLQLAPGWKTYWRSPGDAGLPPQFDWSGSANLAGAQLHWPTPQVFERDGVQTIGYRDELILPIELTPVDPTQPMQIAARIDLGICEDVCMPAALDLDANLGGAQPQPTEDPRIAAALAHLPETETGGVACAVEPISDGVRVTARFDTPGITDPQAVVIEPAEAGIWVSDAVLEQQEGKLTAEADLVPGAGKPFDLDTSGLRMTVLGKDGAVEITGCD